MFFPRVLRIKAIQSLAQFNDKEVLDELIVILEDPHNYDYFYEISNLSKSLNLEYEFEQKFRKAAYRAMNMD